MKKRVEICFVHLGGQLPGHLLANIRHVKKYFPERTIHLIVSKDSTPQEVPDYVSIHRYLGIPFLDEQIERLFKESKFRNGFWRFTLERIFAFLWLSNQLRDVPLLHIESDVFIFPYFPFEFFDCSKKFTWMPVDNMKDIASIFYVPNSMQANELLNKSETALLKIEAKTDMYLLRELANEFGESFSYLPTLDSGEMEKIMDGLPINQFDVRDISPNLGLFDAAAIGMWLTGVDPQNNYGVTRYFDSQLIDEAGFFVKPDRLNLTFSPTGKLIALIDDKCYDIYCLHIHSKSLNIFSSDWQHEIKRLCDLSVQKKIYKEFSLKKLYDLSMSNYREKTLIPYLLFSPPLRPIGNLMKSLRKSIIKK